MAKEEIRAKDCHWRLGNNKQPAEPLLPKIQGHELLPVGSDGLTIGGDQGRARGRGGPVGMLGREEADLCTRVHQEGMLGGQILYKKGGSIGADHQVNRQ